MPRPTRSDIAAGIFESSSDNVYLRITGIFETLEYIRNTPLQVNDCTFRPGDIATVTHCYAEPADPKTFYNGQPGHRHFSSHGKQRR